MDPGAGCQVEQVQHHRSRPGQKASNTCGPARRGGDDARGDAMVVKRKAKKARPTSSIIERNRKTEICRNWEKGACTFGDKCAFAHGHHDIKHKTLRDLENEGRIPDASKHHAFPCMSWVATGACSYGPGCVFIHDDRVKSPGEPVPRAPCVAKLIGTGSASGPPRLFCLSGADNDNSGRFFFPDIPKDPDSIELPADHVRYDIRRGSEFSTAYRVWYSFVSVCTAFFSTNNNSNKDNAKTPTTTSSCNTSLSGRTLFPSSGPAATPTPTTVTAAFTYKDAATAGASSGRTPASFAACSPAASSARVSLAGDASTWAQPPSSVNEPSAPPLARGPDHDGEGGCLKPLPVFAGLRDGKSGHLVGTPPPKEKECSVEETDEDGNEIREHFNRVDDLDNDWYLSCPSWSSESFSSHSSASTDSFLSCRRSPPPLCLSWRPELDGAAALSYGGCAGTATLSTADAGSWSSSASILGDEHDHHHHNNNDNNSDRFPDGEDLIRFEPDLLSPSQTATDTPSASAFGGASAGRLPVFARLHSDDPPPTSGNGNNGSGPNEDGGVLHGYGGAGGHGVAPLGVDYQVQQVCYPREHHHHHPQQEQPFAGFSTPTKTGSTGNMLIF